MTKLPLTGPQSKFVNGLNSGVISWLSELFEVTLTDVSITWAKESRDFWNGSSWYKYWSLMWLVNEVAMKLSVVPERLKVAKENADCRYWVDSLSLCTQLKGKKVHGHCYSHWVSKTIPLDKAVFNWVSKVIRVWFGFTLPRSVIG